MRFFTMTVEEEQLSLTQKNIDIVSTQSASDKLWCDDDYWQLLDACKRQSSSRLNAAAY